MYIRVKQALEALAIILPPDHTSSAIITELLKFINDESVIPTDKFESLRKRIELVTKPDELDPFEIVLWINAVSPTLNSPELKTDCVKGGSHEQVIDAFNRWIKENRVGLYIVKLSDWTYRSDRYVLDHFLQEINYVKVELYEPK